MSKHKLTILYCLFFILTSCGQVNELGSKFRSDITEYLNAYNKADWGKVTSMIYPGFFSVVSKIRVIQTLTTLDSVGMKRTFTLKSIDKISDVIVNGNEKYCRVYYSTRITALINELQLENLVKFKDDFEEDYGKENVGYDDKRNLFTIEAHQSLIAVADKNSDNWKFMELNNEHAFDLVGQAIPKDVFKELTK